MKKGKIVLGIFLTVFLFAILSIDIASAAMAGANVTLSPGPALVRYGNYTTTINVSIVTSMINTSTTYDSNYNATLFCNKSGGAVTKSLADVGIIKIITLFNGTNGNATAGSKQATLENASVRISTIIPANESTIMNCSIWAENSTDQNWSLGNALYNPSNITNLTFDSTPPNVSSTLVGQISYGNYTGTLILNVSANDAVIGINSVFFNITYSNGSQVNFSVASSAGGYHSISIDTTTFADNYYNITVTVNDTLNNANASTKITYLAFDKTAPTGSYSCSPSSVHSGDTITCTCATSDALSGVNSTATSLTSSPSTSDTGTFSLTCGFKDMAGNSGSAGASYTVELYYSSGGTSGGTATTTTSASKVSSFTQITPGAATIIKNFNADTGLKEIQIDVSNPAQNVRITVTKYDGKPAEVSVEKTGKVYKYLQINTTNLADKLSNAKFTIKVNKTWVSSNSLTKDKIALFRLANNQWSELPTTYKEEDANYYYYDAESPGFSYFAISEKATVTETPTTPTQPSGETPVETSTGWSWNNWMWVLLGAIVVIVAALVLFFKIKKKR